MKILELGKFYPPVRGGIETLLESFCRGFARKGADVRCVVANTRAKTSRESENGIRLVRCASFGSLMSTSICPGYGSEARRESADIWHAHFPNPLADLAILRAPKSARVVVTYHSDIVRQAGLMKLYGSVVQRMLRRADKIIVATPRNLEFSPWLQPHARKVEVIPFGIKTDRLEQPRALPPEVPGVGSGPILLTVGRLVGYKGHRYLIEAMRQIEGTLWIVGTGPLEAELKAQAAESAVSDRVHFLGDVDETVLPALYQRCDVFVLPSITPNEAFGLVQLEAMACGKPVVSCELASGVPWVNQHEQTGLVVAPGDSKGLASAVKRVIEDSGLASNFGHAGRERIRQEFSKSRMIEEYYAAFEKLLAN